MAEGLEQLGLADIRLVVRLMCLAAAGRANFANSTETTSNSHLLGPLDGIVEEHNAGSSSSLTYLSAAIGSLASTNPSAAKLLVQLCTKVYIFIFLKKIVHNLLDKILLPTD